DRHVAIELRIATAIHLAHSACSDRGDELVRTKPGAGGQTHVGRWPIIRPTRDFNPKDPADIIAGDDRYRLAVRRASRPRTRVRAVLRRRRRMDDDQSLQPFVSRKLVPAGSGAAVAIYGDRVLERDAGVRGA